MTLDELIAGINSRSAAAPLGIAVTPYILPDVPGLRARRVSALSRIARVCLTSSSREPGDRRVGSAITATPRIARVSARCRSACVAPAPQVHPKSAPRAAEPGRATTPCNALAADIAS
jgi:hypothetical protein